GRYPDVPDQHDQDEKDAGHHEDVDAQPVAVGHHRHVARVDGDAVTFAIHPAHGDVDLGKLVGQPGFKPVEGGGAGRVERIRAQHNVEACDVALLGLFGYAADVEIAGRVAGLADGLDDIAAEAAEEAGEQAALVGARLWPRHGHGDHLAQRLHQAADFG